MYNESQIAAALDRAPHVEGALAVIFVDNCGARFIGLARTTVQADAIAWRARIAARKIYRATVRLPGGATSMPFFVCHS